MWTWQSTLRNADAAARIAEAAQAFREKHGLDAAAPVVVYVPAGETETVLPGVTVRAGTLPRYYQVEVPA